MYRDLSLTDQRLMQFQINLSQQFVHPHQLLRHFRQPAAVREVSLFTHRDFVKKRRVELLKQSILDSLPEKIKKNKPRNLIST